MVNIGLMPTFQISPSSPVMQSMTQFLTAGQRKSFGDFSRAAGDPHRLRRNRVLGAARGTSRADPGRVGYRNA
jgi:hypothetical protein